MSKVSKTLLTKNVLVTTTTYNTGTASQTAFTITGSGTTFTSAMVGGTIIYNSGEKTIVTAFNSATSLTAAVSQSVALSTYVIYYSGTQIDSQGNLGTKNLMLGGTFVVPSEAKGDLWAAGGTSFSRLPVGTNNQLLKADNTQTFGMQWVTAASDATLAAFNDDVFRVRNAADITRQLAFDLSGLPTATTRSLAVPDPGAASTSVILKDTAAAAQQINKALSIGTSAKIGNFNIQPDATISQISTNLTGENTRCVAFDNYLLVFGLATSVPQMRIYDVSVATIPIALFSGRVDTLSAGGVIGRLTFHNTTNNILYVVNWNNPFIPLLFGSVVLQANSYTSTLANYGKYVYVGSSTVGSIQIVDTTALTTATISVGVDFVLALYVSGNQLFAATSTGKFFNYSLANPASPVLIGTTIITSAAESTSTIAVVGSYAFVSHPSLNKISVCNYYGTSLIGTITTNSQPNSIIVTDKVMYVAHFGANNVVFYDIRTPGTLGSIVVLGTLTLSGAGFWTMATSGRYLYGFTSTNLQVFDLGGAYIAGLETGSLRSYSASLHEMTTTKATIQDELTVYGGTTVRNNMNVSGTVAAATLSSLATSNQVALGTTNVTTLTTSANVSGAITQTLPMRTAVLRSEDAGVIRVEKSGNNTNGSRGGAPYLTIAQALSVAASGDVILVSPGTYTESGLTVPDGVSLVGASKTACIISALGVTVGTTLLNFSGTTGLLQNFTLTVTSSTADNLIHGISGLDTGCRISNCVINVTHTATSIASPPCGIITATTATVSTIDNLEDCELIISAVNATTGGTVTGINNQNTATHRIKNSIIKATTGAGAGSYGLFNSLSGVLQMRGGELFGTTAPYVQTGTTSLSGVVDPTSKKTYFTAPSGQIVLGGEAVANTTTLSTSANVSGAAILTLPMRTAVLRSEDNNVIRVEKGGNDTNGARGGAPFLTIVQALAAAASGDVVKIGPGTYTESGLTIPSGVTVVGDSTVNCVISSTAVTINTTMVSMSTSGALRNVTLTLQNVTTANLTLIGVDFLTTSATNASVRDVNINITNTVASASGTFMGVRSAGTGTAPNTWTNLIDCQITVNSTATLSGTSVMYGVGVTTQANTFNAINCIASATAGTTVNTYGVAITIASGVLAFQTGKITGTTADYLRSAGTLNLLSTTLGTSGAVAESAASNQIQLGGATTTAVTTLTTSANVSGAATLTLPMRTAVLRSEDANVIRVEKSGNDTNGTRGGAPFLTIAAALGAAGITGGDVVMVGPGTYSEAITIPANVSVIGYNKSSCVLSLSGVVANTTMVNFGAGASIHNFTITVTSATSGVQAAGLLNFSPTCRICNCIVSCTQTNAVIGSGAQCIVTTADSTTSTIDNIEDCELIATAASATSGNSIRGVSNSGTGTWRIKNTTIKATSGAGALAYGLFNTTTGTLQMRGGELFGTTAPYIQTGTTSLSGVMDPVNKKTYFTAPSDQVQLGGETTGTTTSLDAAAVSANRKVSILDYGVDTAVPLMKPTNIAGGTMTTYTTSQLITIPTNTTTIIAKVWGAGGASGTSFGNGGAGAFASCAISVTPGAQYYVSVGAKGTPNTGGGGGVNAAGGISNGGGGGGGQASIVYSFSGTSYTAQVIAGAGGGSSNYADGCDAGGGGQNNINNTVLAGSGGTGGAGAGGSGGNFTLTVSSLALANGNGGGGQAGSGGGGGGGYGGGSGEWNLTHDGAAGGGSYAPGGTINNASYLVPGNSTDADFVAAGGTSTYAAQNKQGLVIIQFVQSRNIFLPNNAIVDSNVAPSLTISPSDKTAGTGNGGDVLINGGASSGGSPGLVQIGTTGYYAKFLKPHIGVAEALSPSLYATGTAAQSTTTVTGTGTTFTSAMIGGIIVWASGSTATITGFTSATSLTVTPSQTVSPTSAYTIFYGGTQLDNLGNQYLIQSNASTRFALQSTTKNISAVELEPTEVIPNYPYQSGAATLAGTTTFQGAIYNIIKPVVITKIQFSIATNVTPGPTDVVIYQRAGGAAATTATPASLVAFGRVTGATGTNSVAITQGTGVISPGVCYIMYGQESGNPTFRTYTNIAFPSLNGAEVPAGYAPVSFTTAITANSSPAATFDPTVSATGVSTNVPMVVRLLV